MHLNSGLSVAFEEQVKREERLKSDVLRDAVIAYLEKHKESILPNVIYPTTDSESLP